ncbi:MAG TPA: GNAT family N-acetyltransferase [Anaerolineae bacterium]|nr:GNAT family N-acetyltransferase [Anaerolineae bacterium]
MNILKASEIHDNAWLQLRKLLWPDTPDATHMQEMFDIISSDTTIAFLMFTPENEPVGFIEGALYRNPPRNYGYIEGWFVLPDYRKQGLGGQLLEVLELWFLHHNIDLSLSDTIPLEYPLSPEAHAKYGYREHETLQIFIKELDPGNNRESDNQMI